MKNLPCLHRLGGNLKNNDNTYPPLWNVSAKINALFGWAMSGVDVV